MVRMGVRELKDNLSSALRSASAGQIIEVTEHGHPLARIVPIRRQGGYEQLLADGRITPPEAHTGSILDYEPPPLAAGERLGSEILAELRADER